MLKRCFILCWVVILACIAGIAEAQVTVGGIRGIVKDETAAVLVGVTVEAESPARIGKPAVTVTNNIGLYRFENMPPGVYTVTFSLQGFTTIRRENVRVEVGRTTQLEMTLPLAGAQETVTVTAASPVIDTVHADYATNFSQELVKNIPTTRNSYFDVVTAVPGVHGDISSNVMRFSIYGATSDQNSFQMDGVDTTGLGGGTPWQFINYDAVQEIEVLGVGASPEFYGFQGAAINVISKSGSNEWKGMASFFFSNDQMVGNNTPDEEFPPRTDYNADVTFEIGGPIIKDRLWVIGIVQRHRWRGVPVGVELTPEIRAGDETRPFFKVTAQFSEKDTLNVSFDDNYFSSPNPPSRTRPPETSTYEHGHNPVISARWTHMFGSNTLMEVQAGGIYIRDRDDNWFDDFDTPGRFDFATGMNIDNAMGSWRTHQNKTQAAASLTHYADDFIKGSHDFKFGVQFRRYTQKDFWTYLGANYSFYYDYYGYPYYALFKDPSGYGASLDNDSFFVNDNWTLTSRVTLNLGLRFDHSTGGVPEIAQLDRSIEDPTGTTFPAQPGLIKFNNWSPRLGITFQLDESAKTVAKASYGRLFGRILGNWIKRLSDGNLTTFARLYDEDTGEYDIPFWFVDPNVNLGLDPNLQNQYTDQFYVGLEREILPDFGLDVGFIYRKENNFVRVEDVGGTYEAVPFEDEFEGQTQTLTVHDRVSRSSESLYQLTNRDDFDHSYKSVVIQGNKRWSDGWTLNGSYQWQRGLGYAGGGQGAGSQSFSSLSPRAFGADPNDLINAYGRLPTDSTHTVKISTAFELPYGITTGIRYRYEDGRPFGRLINVTGLGQGVREVLAEKRGAYKLESVHDLGVRLDKDFLLGERMRLRLSVDIFNVFNRANGMTVRNNSTQAGEDFLQETQVPLPRRAMFGIRFEF